MQTLISRKKLLKQFDVYGGFLKESDASLWQSQTKLNFKMNQSKLIQDDAHKHMCDL